jgi:hypothetical protein
VVECHAGVRKSASNPGGERSGTDRRHGPDAGASQRSSRAFCAVSQPRGVRLLLCAPTGRAAKRITEAGRF